MKKPLISIITVVRNAAPELELTLRNLVALDTSAARVELIVVDGASNDRTPQVIRRFRAELGYWVSEPDGGLYDAMNKGIRAATGDYLWFINAGDTVYAPDTLTRIFAPPSPPQISPEQWADVYYGEAMVVEAGTQRELGLRRKRLPSRLTWKSLVRGMVVCHQSLLVRRSIAPLYDTAHYRLAADIAWVIECLKRARTVKHTGLILSRFAAGGLSSRRRLESLRERWTIMRRYYGLWPTLRAHVGFLFGFLSRF